MGKAMIHGKGPGPLKELPSTMTIRTPAEEKTPEIQQGNIADRRGVKSQTDTGEPEL